MSDYKQYLDKKVINKYGEEGCVIEYDGVYIVIGYDNKVKTYNLEVAIKNGFIRFVDEELDSSSKEEVDMKLEQKEQEKEAILETNRKEINKIKRVFNTYKDLSEKNYMMQRLFGYDFIYPPYVEFMKKYRHVHELANKKYFHKAYTSYRDCFKQDY